MGKYDEEYHKIANEQADVGFSQKDLMFFYWLSRIANEMAENNRLIRQGQSIPTGPDGEFIDPEENIDKA